VFQKDKNKLKTMANQFLKLNIIVYFCILLKWELSISFINSNKNRLKWLQESSFSPAPLLRN